LRSLFGYTKRLDLLCEKVAGLESKVEQVLKRIGELGALRRSFLVPIESLEPEPYEITKPFTAVVMEAEGEFEAGIFDLSTFASGDTEEEAIANLKETLVDTVDRLNGLPDARLGKGPLRQKRLLNKCIRRVEKG
jgi:hypothetical protein